MSALDDLYEITLRGKRNQVEEAVRKALDEGVAPLDIIEKTLRPAMMRVGELFSTGKFFLPELLLAASAMKKATDYLRPLLAGSADINKQETMVIGTVQGDLHDIGKNLVIAIMEGAGYRVIDLGIDVPPEKFVQAVREYDPAVVGLSALLSTTMVNIPKTIQALKEAGVHQGRVLAVGGAPVTQRAADQWGAHVYAPDAGTALHLISQALASRN